MSDEREVLEAAAWLMQTSRLDDDVKLGITSVCAQRGYDTPTEFAEADPEGFLAIVAALKDMTEQIPVDETKSVGRGMRRVDAD